MTPNRIFFLLLVALAWPGQLLAALPVAPFEARYTVYGQGIPLGESMLTLSDAGQGRYRMRSDVHPNGAAALLITDSISEQASGEIRDGVVRPASYTQKRRGGKKAGTTQLDFDWRDGVLKARNEDETATLPLTEGAIDPLSLHLQVMWDLQRGRRPSTYTLAQDTELKTYEVKLEGEETVATPMGKLRALRVSRSKPGSSRITTFWFAPALKYMLVQVAQANKGKETLRMVIEEVRGLKE